MGRRVNVPSPPTQDEPEGGFGAPSFRRLFGESVGGHEPFPGKIETKRTAELNFRLPPLAKYAKDGLPAEAARGFRLNYTSRLTVSRIYSCAAWGTDGPLACFARCLKLFRRFCSCAHMNLSYHPCSDFCIVLMCTPEQNVSGWTGKGGLWLPPRNARMRPAPALSPIKRNIAATTAKASGTRWRSCACAATLIVAARLLEVDILGRI